MEYAKCVELKGVTNGELKLNGRYWLDFNSEVKNEQGDIVLDVYTSENGEKLIGTFLKTNFSITFRYLKYGGHLSTYVNCDYPFLLKDIVEWAATTHRDQLAEKVLLYIIKNIPNYKELGEKEYLVCSRPFREFAAENRENEYLEFLGYYLKPYEI